MKPKWRDAAECANRLITSCWGWFPHQPTPGWMLVFLAVRTEQASRLSQAFLSNAGAPPAVIVHLVWLQRNSLLIHGDWWAQGKGSRLWPYQSRSISCSSHLLPWCLSHPACSQWKCEWASRWSGRGGAHSNYTPQDKLYCAPVSSSKS